MPGRVDELWFALVVGARAFSLRVLLSDEDGRNGHHQVRQDPNGNSDAH